MRGLLSDVNVEFHAFYLQNALRRLGLWSVLAELKLEFVTFRDLHFPQDLDDRSLWNRCQDQGWVLLTENRNQDGPDSLEATLIDSWQPGHLPILTLANKSRFERNREYAHRVASDVAEILFDLVDGTHRNHARIYVPR